MLKHRAVHLHTCFLLQWLLDVVMIVITINVISKHVPAASLLFKRAMLWLHSAGAVLLHSAVRSEVGSGSFTCQCSGQPLQPAQASRRPLTQQHIGSSLRSVA